jgi:GNAT superfamily N-acetyltransferase
VSDDDRNRLLAAFDRQLRGTEGDRLPEGAAMHRDGPLERITGRSHRGFIGYRDLGGLDGAELDELIARQVTCFADRGEAVEWKLYGHDRPADLADHLHRAGFRPEPTETVVIAPVASILTTPSPPAGVTLREVTSLADFERIASLQDAVWGEDHSHLPAHLAGEQAADPEGIIVVVAEAAGDVVSAAWVQFPERAEFATLWGGATHAAWRRRGIYRALVAHRASLAARRDYRYLQVDASDDSRPILERLGFVAVTTTTPYVWTPPGER